MFILFFPAACSECLFYAGVGEGWVGWRENYFFWLLLLLLIFFLSSPSYISPQPRSPSLLPTPPRSPSLLTPTPHHFPPPSHPLPLCPPSPLSSFSCSCPPPLLSMCVHLQSMAWDMVMMSVRSLLSHLQLIISNIDILP